MGFLVGFIDFFMWAFKKNGWFFCLGPIKSTPKIVMDV